MSTSPANADDRLGHLAQSFRCAKDEGLLSALSAVPDFPFGDATSHPVDRKSDDHAQPATILSPPLCSPPLAGDGGAGARDVKRSQTIILPNGRQIAPPNGNKLPPRDLTPEWVIQPHGYVGMGRPTPRLRRRGHSLKKLMVTSAIAAMVGGAFVVQILILVQGADFPSLPKFASAAPPLSKAVLPSTDFRAIINLSEPERMTQAMSLRPTVSLQPMAPSENQPTESGIEVTLPHMVPGSGYEKAVGKTAAIRRPPAIEMLELTPMEAPELAPVVRPEPLAIAAPELPSIARPEPKPITALDSTPMARLELTPESPPIARPTPESSLMNQALRPIGKAIVADRPGFLFADSKVRYLSRGELQRLSPDQLHVARNEIFARRGRYFKDDGLRAYFSQFPWYQPHAWDVPLGPVEKVNVGLIQSVEAPAAASRGITEPVPAQTKVDNSVAVADPSRRYLTPEELQGLSVDQLVILRNEIFARKGRYFKDDALRVYFSQFPWYQPHAWDVPLSPIEQANVKLVQSFEPTAPTPRQASRVGRAPPM